MQHHDVSVRVRARPRKRDFGYLTRPHLPGDLDATQAGQGEQQVGGLVGEVGQQRGGVHLQR